MSNLLFGLDIAGLVNNAMSSAGGLLPGTITRQVPGPRDENNPTAGRPMVPHTSTFQGFIERYTQTKREGSSIFEAGEYVSLLGASITPAIVPQPGDAITIEGRNFTVEALADRDPAAALYVVKVTTG